MNHDMKPIVKVMDNAINKLNKIMKPKNVKELEATIECYESALEYIMLLSDKKNPHLGYPRLSDTKCIYCMAYFALNNGAYGYYITTNDYKKLKSEL